MFQLIVEGEGHNYKVYHIILRNITFLIKLNIIYVYIYLFTIYQNFEMTICLILRKNRSEKNPLWRLNS